MGKIPYQTKITHKKQQLRVPVPVICKIYVMCFNMSSLLAIRLFKKSGACFGIDTCNSCCPVFIWYINMAVIVPADALDHQQAITMTS